MISVLCLTRLFCKIMNDDVGGVVGVIFLIIRKEK